MRESAKVQKHEQYNGPKERRDAAHDGPGNSGSPEQAHRGPVYMGQLPATHTVMFRCSFVQAIDSNSVLKAPT